MNSPRPAFPRLLGSLILLILLTGACSFSPDGGVGAADPNLTPTPTPFQPHNGFSPFASVPTQFPAQTLDANGVPLEEGILVTPTTDAPVIPILNLSADINPLTGLPPSDPALLERRPMVIKVTNFPRYVRPQSGLSLADQVYEYYIEDRLTRFIAVFYGNDAEWVGPVRSGRYFDEHMARMYHAYLVFKFADPREFDYLKNSDISEFLVVPTIGSCPPFRVGEQERDTYNNIFFDTTRFGECLDKEKKDNSRQPLRHGFFSELTPNNAQVAVRVYTRYSVDDYSYWDYDPSTRQYFRYQETVSLTEGNSETYELLTDALTGLPVTAENVVVLFVSHTFANTFEAEDEVYHIDLVNSGNAYVFRDGLVIPARWYRQAEDQPIFIAQLSGAPVFLRPGRTFYQVIGKTSTYYQDDSGWHFEFSTP